MTAERTAPSRLRALRTLLLIGGSAGAALVMAGRAEAQAFAANPTTVAGGVTYSRGTPGVETVFVDTPTAIIVWRPINTSENPVIFLPAGNTATFENGPNNQGGFTVLNRIFTTVPSRFDGTVISRLRDTLGNTTPGGTILFSSPGGIIVGPTAVFDVGNLVLTSLNVVDDGAGNFIQPGGGFLFDGGANAPDAAVVTMAGSQINATAENSYIAFVAPQVTHGGSLRVNGSVAYIAGEEVQMQVDQGLFDIVVTTGSDNVNPIVHTGSTGGPASTGSADPHRIYMVAMPKNQAITALLEGDVGFDAATDVTVENGVIILSAGYNVYGDTVDRYGEFGLGPVPDVDASFHIRGGTIRSRLLGYAVTDMFASGSSTGALTFQQDVSLFAGQRARLFAGTGETVTAMGNVLVSAARDNSTLVTDIDFTGGEALLSAAANGTLIIRGNAVVDASGRGRIDDGGNTGSGTGGIAGVRADGGTVTIDGSLEVRANGAGGFNESTPDQGGVGTGGAIDVTASNGGGITVGGPATFEADGRGSRSNGSVPGEGALGTGGTITFASNGGATITFQSDVDASAGGRGGSVEGGTDGVGGTGQGGDILVDAAGGDIAFQGNLRLAANGLGGIGPDGGIGRGGDIAIEANDADVDLGANPQIFATGSGGDAAFAFGGTGGDGFGGGVTVRARAGASPSTIRGGALGIFVQGSGGDATVGDGGLAGGAGGAGAGGNIVLIAEAGNGNLQLGAVTLQALGLGGGGGSDGGAGGGDGGDADGGSILLGTLSGPPAAQPTGSATFASVDASASAVGGDGATGGDAAGGSVAILSQGAPVTIAGDSVLAADGLAGGGGAEGEGQGGEIFLAASRQSGNGASGSISAGSVTGSASGLGGATSSAGYFLLIANNSNIALGSLDLTAVTTGMATGQPTQIQLTNGTIAVAGDAAISTANDLNLTADGTGRLTAANLLLQAGGDIAIAHSGRSADEETIAATNIDIAAGGDVDAGPGSRTAATDALRIGAMGNANIAGEVDGRAITVISSDIEISGRLGSADTETADLVVRPTGQQTVLGGTTEGPGYTLTDAEANRVRAGVLRLNVPQGNGNPAPPADLLVRDLTLNASGAAAGIGALELHVAGTTRVEGAVLLTGANSGSRLLVRSGERIEVLIPGGSLRARDAGGMPAGTIDLSAGDIWVVGQTLLGQLAADPNFAGRDAALLAGDGTAAPRGFVEANAITLDASRSLFVQNTGGNPDFAGLTVGTGALTIRASGPSVSVYAFGRRLNPDGSFTTGFPFFAEGVYEPGPGGGAFASDAQLNTCVIVTRICPSEPPPDEPGPPRFPDGSDLVKGPMGGSGALLFPPPPGSDDVIDTAMAADPLIPEPITSGGDPALWAGIDEDEEEDEEDEEDEEGGDE